MNPFDEFTTERHPPPFLRRRARTLLGWAALASLLGDATACGAEQPAAGAANGRCTHFAAQGQARHLPAHGRRAAADGPVRLQAGDAASGTTRTCPTSVRMGQRLTTMTTGQARFPDRAVEVQVRAARPVRHVGQRAAAVHGEDGRRHVLHPQHAHRGDQPRAGHHATCRPATRSPAGRASARGRRTASARSTRTCRRSSCWSPSRRTPSRCRRSPPGSGQSGYLPGEHAGVLVPHRPAIRSCTSTTRPACRATSAARRSTASTRSTS